jgi:2-polyprenyl-3-methyl-5-hydroxy-6-metoxy-1,4-benzoquinol methylase
LRDVYERRGETQYAEPVVPDPSLDRKFEVVTGTIRELLPVDSYLDAGCGDGRYLAALPDLGELPQRVVGVDIAESILGTARRATTLAGFEPELVRANLERLPFGGAEFDLVVSVQVLEHLLDPDAGVRELARVLRPGGLLVLSTDNRRMLITKTLNAPRWTVTRAIGRHNSRAPFDFPHGSFGRDELARILLSAGLEVERARTFRFSLVGAPRRLVRAFNGIDRRLPDLGLGDVLLVVARRSSA